jgi:hypothetical protein
MATPSTAEQWVERLEEMMKEVSPTDIEKARSGNPAAQALLKTWAVELQAAAVFIASYQGPAKVSQDTLVEVANQIIDTVQAILLALGIIYLLRKLKKKTPKSTVTIEVDITRGQAQKELGSKTTPIPSRPEADRSKEDAFLFLRYQWTTHFVLTIMQSLLMMDQAEGKEFTRRARKDSITCSICRAMDGEKSVDGDFLPVLLKKFPKYDPYVPVMWWPHAHPRCRCIAVLE